MPGDPGGRRVHVAVPRQVPQEGIPAGGRVEGDEDVAVVLRVPHHGERCARDSAVVVLPEAVEELAWGETTKADSRRDGEGPAARRRLAPFPEGLAEEHRAIRDARRSDESRGAVDIDREVTLRQRRLTAASSDWRARQQGHHRGVNNGTA